MSFDTLLPTLTDPDQRPSARELASLAGLEGADLRRLFDAWGALSIQRRRDIIDALITLAEDNIELDFSAIFKHGLDDLDVQVRAESARALVELEDADVARRYLDLLRDPEAIVRGQAALGLGVHLMRAELLDDQSPLVHEMESALRTMAQDAAEIVEVRGRAIEALGARSHDWVSDLIEEAYNSGDRRLQISAVHAMGRNADIAWMPTLIEEMQSDDGEMRFEAATAAGGLASEGAIPYLGPLTADEDPEVQEAAIMALGEIGGPAARSLLQEVADDTSDERVLEAVSDALVLAEFDADPLGYKLRLDDGVESDLDEVDE